MTLIIFTGMLAKLLLALMAPSLPDTGACSKTTEYTHGPHTKARPNPSYGRRFLHDEALCIHIHHRTNKLRSPSATATSDKAETHAPPDRVVLLRLERGER